jgi:hypothetical protein
MRAVGVIALFAGLTGGGVGQKAAAPPPARAPDNMQQATAPVLPILKVFQFPADQIPRIDGKDDDWSIVPDSYAVTLADMHDDEHKHAKPDAKDLDIKVKVGWVKGLNRLYFLVRGLRQLLGFCRSRPAQRHIRDRGRRGPLGRTTYPRLPE